MERLLLLLLSLVLLAKGSELGISVAFCSQSVGEWRLKLASALEKTTIYSIGETSCNITSSEPAISMVGGPIKEMLFLQILPSESTDVFVNRIIRKLASYRIHFPTDSEQFDNLLKKGGDVVIAYTRNENIPEYSTFCQAILSAEVPNTIPMVSVWQPRLLSPEVQPYAKDNFHLWFVNEGSWNEIHLSRDYAPLTAEAKEEIIGYIKRLSYPAILPYSAGNVEKVYKGSGFTHVLIFHHSDQLGEVTGIINELARSFRPYYVFITIDGDKNEDKMSQYYLNLMTKLPYIIIQKPDQDDGIHINSQYIEYTSESLSNLLKSLIKSDPHVQDGVTNREDVSLSFIHSSQLVALKEEDSPVIGILCKQGSDDLNVLHQVMKEAISNVINTQHRLLAFMVEAGDIDDVRTYGVKALPAVLVKYVRSYKFELVGLTDINALALTELMMDISTSGNGYDGDDEPHSPPEDTEEDTSHSLKQFYDSFPQLREDESAGHLYGFIGTGALPLLTSDNITSFINSSRPSAVAFYVPYCLQCRPMLLHLISFYEVKDENVQVGVVNCAAYPDVCASFEISVYPSIKIRKGGEQDWTLFEGIFTAKGLRKSLQPPHVDNEDSVITELDLASLLQIEVLPSLNIYFTSSYKLSGFEERIIKEVTGQKIYWMNFNKQPRLLEMLTGTNAFPAIVHVDYEKKSVYHFTVEMKTQLSDIDNFFLDIKNGRKPVSKTLGNASWRPSKPSISFPSKLFKDLQKRKERKRPNNPSESSPPPAPPPPREQKKQVHNEL